jgi:4,5-DOPA dioxygenase extradiol
VLIVASGNIVHNLRRIAWDRPDEGFDWARRFDDAARALLVDAPGDVLALAGHPEFDLAVPTPDHFIPLLYTAALAAAGDEKPAVLVDGYAYGSISMTCITAGADPPPSGAADGAAAALPDAAVVPPEQSNL